MRFTKMQGAGNDYVYLDCTQAEPEGLPALAVRLADRHFGVGGDGLVCICPSERADFRMRIFNADGSEAEMCGNGIRCLGKYVYDKGLTDRTTLAVETPAGVRMLELEAAGGTVGAVTVDMGEPQIGEPQLLAVKGREYLATPVSMGNPHAVVFLNGIGNLNLQELGPDFEHHAGFPERVNTEFVEVLASDRLRVRVWERGSGETLACGTGACAALACAVLRGRADRKAQVALPGGSLDIRWDEEDNHIYLTGPAVTVFEGEYT